ncbi:uncharacterized protein KGF55_001154 [Candida pseudojiufengensis]|uniref:uncharacterized protein n=1 Tax=Candida pseudojiufengensis TaxID=497109 RepID=UPI00222461C4|nr:uncharacterized protein KGF55_001154 [Candida pseudojiufengensis]KAI5965791.1 hypothetical protein KGF55_001154 [Candida pseudojiufengensis]
MGRAEIGTAKYESKRLKASGLQKLKFYCQLCSKQCRDSNGFKMHLNSKSHLGRISNITNDNSSSKIITNYSNEFQRNFLSLLKQNHGNKKINANKFYQKYIIQKDHIHMNVTRWKSLTSFVKYLGSNGIVKVTKTGGEDEMDDIDDENFQNDDQQGFNLEIQLIDNSNLAKIKEKDNNNQIEKDQALEDKLLQEQIRLGKEKEAKEAKSKEQQNVEEVLKEETSSVKVDGPVKISLNKPGIVKKNKKMLKKNEFE